MTDDSDATDEPSYDTDVASPSRRNAAIAIGVAVVVAVIVFGVIFPQLVDWDEVFDVLGSVSSWDLAVIFGLGLIRYVPAGWIYVLVLPGLPLMRGVQAWVASSAVSSTLPGFDLVVRMAMYRSWGFAVERATSGMLLSGLVEVSARLLVAVMAVLVWGLVSLELDALAIGGIALAALVVVAFAVVGILRSEDRARRTGELVQRVVRWVFATFGRQAPQDLVDRVLGVRVEARRVLGTRWPQAYLAALIGQAIVYTILLLSIRAVGIDDEVLSWADVLLAFAVTSIITTIPITPGSVGIAALSLVTIFSLAAGREVASVAAAGVILYRVATWLITIPIGWLATLRWQSTSGVKLFGGGSDTTTAGA